MGTASLSPPLPPPAPINLFTATDVFTTTSKAEGEGGVLGAGLTRWCEVCHPPFPVLRPWVGSPRLAGGCRLHGSRVGAQQGTGRRCQNWHWPWEVAPQGVCTSPFPRASPRGLSQGFPCTSTSSMAHRLQNAPAVGNNIPETPPVLLPCIAALVPVCPHLSAMGHGFFSSHSSFMGILQPCGPSYSGSSAMVFASGLWLFWEIKEGSLGSWSPSTCALLTLSCLLQTIQHATVHIQPRGMGQKPRTPHHAVSWEEAM